MVDYTLPTAENYVWLSDENQKHVYSNQIDFDYCRVFSWIAQWHHSGFAPNCYTIIDDTRVAKRLLNVKNN